jgi:NAD(P)-dependent dehydrogenase (short-subunit alcohol dehydrogenase family)
VTDAQARACPASWTGLHPGTKVSWRPGAKILCVRPPLIPAPNAVAVRAIVTGEDDVIAMVTRTVDEIGHVDILCDNAAEPGQDMWA